MIVLSNNFLATMQTKIIYNSHIFWGSSSVLLVMQQWIFLPIFHKNNTRYSNVIAKLYPIINSFANYCDFVNFPYSVHCKHPIAFSSLDFRLLLRLIFPWESKNNSKSSSQLQTKPSLIWVKKLLQHYNSQHVRYRL